MTLIIMQPVSQTRNYWTAEEDRILREQAMLQVNTFGNVKDWNIIATKLVSRTNKGCRKRWTKLETSVNKGAWSSDEDHRLRKAIDQRGLSWTLVARDVQTRHADQCAKRWYHFLDPNLIHDEWNEDEDTRLVEAVRVHGRAWREINEKEFPGRSSTDLKNRYIMVQRRRLTGKSPAPSSPSHSPSVGSPLSGPSTAFSSGMTSESDSDSKRGELVQGLSPGELQAFDDINNILDFQPSHFPDEDIYVDMSLLSDIIDSCPGAVDPLSPQLTTGKAGTSCSPPSRGMTEHSDHTMTQAPDLAPFSSLYAPSDASWLDSGPQMHVDQHIDLSPSESSEFMMHPLPNINLQGAHRYNLLLEDVPPQILSHIMDIVLKSHQHVKMKLSNAEP